LVASITASSGRAFYGIVALSPLSPTSMGVRGCGKQGRYEFVTYVGWVLNSGDEKATKE
jgi:hypothetical protein